ncbi:hypothetical protein ACFL6Y_09175 [Elusimicrobiota bacterium]
MHELPVAVIRKAHGRCVLSPRSEVKGVRPVALKPWGSKSIIEVAQKCAQLLKTSKAKSQYDLARKMRMSRCRVLNLLSLLKLAPEIQDYLVKTRDNGGRIRERELRPLLRIGVKRKQLGGI